MYVICERVNTETWRLQDIPSAFPTTLPFVGATNAVAMVATKSELIASHSDYSMTKSLLSKTHGCNAQLPSPVSPSSLITASQFNFRASPVLSLIFLHIKDYSYY